MTDLTPVEKFHALVDEIANQEDFTDEHVLRVHDLARAGAERIREELDWQLLAHVHDTTHAYRDGATNTFVCHDCKRELISDVGLDRILICPKLHGRRPPALRPKKANGAVECGQPGI